MMDQIWFCLDCETCGQVVFREVDGAYQVASLIHSDHWETSKTLTGRGCRSDPRIVNPFDDPPLERLNPIHRL